MYRYLQGFNFLLFSAFGFGGCNAIFTILSEKGKNAIVSKHNELRRKVAKGEELGQPPAANMREMVWSEELAELAQNSINSDPTCYPDHDNTDMYGQNIGMDYANYEEQDQSTAELLFPKIVNSWYSEVEFFHRSPSRFTYNPVDGHYTQVVWADSHEVGCGTAYYPKDDQFYISMVCNYRVAGNIASGASLYTEGKACSACPDGTSCSNGLCA